MNKIKAIQFIEFVISGKIKEAFDQFIHPEGSHHNAHVQTGFNNLKVAMLQDFEVNPKKKYEIISATAENEHVALLVKMNVRDKVYLIAYFFRFEAGKIKEMWDVPQEISE